MQRLRDHSGLVISSVLREVRGLEEEVDHAPVPVEHGLEPVDPLLEQHHGGGQLVHGHRHQEQRCYDEDEGDQYRLQIFENISFLSVKEWLKDSPQG